MPNKPTYGELEKRVHNLENVVKDQEKLIETLRETEKNFHFFYHNTPVAYQSLDKNGHLIEVNNAWLTTLGYDREQVIGKSFGNFLHSDWKEHFNENFPRFKAVGEVLDVEFEMIKNNGESITVLFRGTTDEENFLQTHCFFEDITDRKRDEEESARFSHLLEHSLNEIYVFDAETLQFLNANRGARQNLGYHLRNCVA